MFLKLINNFFSDIYKIEFFRTSISFLRFIFFFKILGKNHKFKNSKEILDDHITLHRDNKNLGVDDHNLHYSENLLNLKKIYHQFSVGKPN